MFKDAQYHELIRKTIVAFGTLFNDIYIYRKSSTGKVTQKMKVPLAYGPKQKFLTRIDQDSARSADDAITTALTLPRIGFELTSLSYDPARKDRKSVVQGKSVDFGGRRIIKKKKKKNKKGECQEEKKRKDDVR